jgi:ferredoxin
VKRQFVTIRVDPVACDGHGLCEELFPERISLDDWGFPMIDPSPIPPQLEVHARRAASECPTCALSVGRVDR